MKPLTPAPAERESQAGQGLGRASMAPYSAEISRWNPTCFLFLVDQSASMREPLAGAMGKRKAEIVADAINDWLIGLIIKSMTGGNLVNRFYVGAIGYGEIATPILQIPKSNQILMPVAEVAHHPLELHDVPMPAAAELGAEDGTVQRPIWIKPEARGRTKMCHAIELATKEISRFVSENPKCYPPIVLNITDGMPTDGDPRGAGILLRSIRSTNGYTLLFNVHLSAIDGERLIYPGAIPQSASVATQLLFDLSSALPPAILSTARAEFPEISDQARGFAFNADLASFIRFLDIGTRSSISQRM